MLNYLLNFEIFFKNEALFVQSLNKVYQAKDFGIQSLFILIQFEIDQIFCDRLNIAVTYSVTCRLDITRLPVLMSIECKAFEEMRDREVKCMVGIILDSYFYKNFLPK
jgi:hypothetical protein